MHSYQYAQNVQKETHTLAYFGNSAMCNLYPGKCVAFFMK